jgi:sigma-B regulation protein RsbU (phosphoserine phosphatase)
MDSLLLVGNQDPLLSKLLNKLGYAFFSADGDSPVAQILSKHIVDLIVIDARGDFPAVPMTEYFRSDDRTKKTPIVYITKSKDEVKALQASKFERMDYVETPYTVGTLASRIATSLRLRKIAGGANSDAHSNLSDVNAALRDHNERFAREMRDAKKIQLALLPRDLPKDDRFEMGVVYKSLDDVGGDWYFIQKTPSNKWSVQIADATGHGLAAALTGSMTKLALSAAQKEAPHELLNVANRLMSPQMPEGRFVTIESYLYDPATGALQFARGGHPPGFLYKAASKEVQLLEGSGFAIGFFEDAEYSLIEAKLEVGDILIVTTDGTTEAQNRAGKFFGNDGVSAALKCITPEMSADGVVKHVIKQFEKFVDGRLLKDDVTVLALRRTQ